MGHVNPLPPRLCAYDLVSAEAIEADRKLCVPRLRAVLVGSPDQIDDDDRLTYPTTTKHAYIHTRPAHTPDTPHTLLLLAGCWQLAATSWQQAGCWP